MRPYLEYAVSVWSLHLQKDIDMLEKTQKFATKVCTKLWDWSYHELLMKLHLPTLTQRRLHIDLCLIYKIIHGLMYFPPDIVTPSTTVIHNPRSLLLQEPFARTNAYKNSFYLGQHLTGTHYLIMLFCLPLPTPSLHLLPRRLWSESLAACF